MDNNSDGALDVYRPVVHKQRADLVFLAAIGILFVTATPIGLPTLWSRRLPLQRLHTHRSANIIILAANIFIVNIIYLLTPLQ